VLVKVPVPVTVPPIICSGGNRLRIGARIERAGGDRVGSDGQGVQHHRARGGLIQTGTAAQRDADRSGLEVIGRGAGERAGAGDGTAGELEGAELTAKAR